MPWVHRLTHTSQLQGPPVPPSCTAGSVTEYKYVLLDASATQVMAWQDGNNSLLAVRLAEGGLAGGIAVLDDW